MNIFGKIWDKITNALPKRPVTVTEIDSTVAHVWNNPNDREQIAGIIQSFEKEEQKRVIASINQLKVDIQKLDVEKAKLEDKLLLIKTIDTPDISAINDSIEKLNQYVAEKVEKKPTIHIFKSKSTDGFDAILIQNNLLKQFQDREIARKKKEEQHKREVRAKLDTIAMLLNQDKLDEAKTLISLIQNQIKSSYKHEIERLEKSQRKLKDRELQIFVKRQYEEQIRRDEEAKRLKEEIERRKKAEEEEREREERERNAKWERQRQEREQLNALLTKKSNWQDFQQILQKNDIKTLYHFTDKANIKSIKEHGGLFSWHYCDTKGIEIPKTGGDTLSRDLDTRYKLQDFVRVSFCNDHPMMYRLQQKGYDLVLLQIKTNVCYFEHSIFSDINATDSEHSHGSNLSDLQRINFNATKQNFVSRESPIFKQHQAEVLVKTWIPIEYITNINKF